MKTNWVIIALAVLVSLVVVIFITRLHKESEREVLIQFQEHQLSHAEQLASQLKFLLQSHSRSLQVLSSVASSLRYGDPQQKRADIWAVSKRLETVSVESVSVYDETGTIVYSTDDHSIGSNYGRSDFFAWAKKRENRGKVLGLPVFRRDSFVFFLACPLYQSSPKVEHSKLPGRFLGLISLTLDLKEFLSKQIYLLDPKGDFRRVWILDKEGRLLFHSEHPEMIRRSIHERDENCRQCHVSFDYIGKILKERHGTVNYQASNLRETMSAFAPVELEDASASWIAVVNSFPDEVAALVRKSLRDDLMLLGFIFFAFLAGSALAIRNDRLKVRAEEESKRWQEQVAERKKTEEVLRESETKYRIVADNTYDWEWWRDADGNFIYVSPSCKKVTHHEAEEFIRDPDLLLRITHPDDKPAFVEHKTEVEEKHSQGEVEFRILRPDGSIRWIDHGCQPVFDEQGRFFGRRGSNRDITEHKWAEEALRESEKQLRHLSSQLLTSQETERRRISRELHDELGGALALLKLRCSSIEKNLQKDETGVREQCKQNVQYIDQIIENVGRLSRDLSPSILEDLGLSAALRRLIDNFVKNYNVKVACDNLDVDHLFRKDSQIVIYRIFQETLTNIGKHAQARNVSVKFKENADRIFFLIEDDGKGFDVKHAAMKEGSERGLGLATMDERARMLGGSFDLWSEEGKGTRITLGIPIRMGESL
jgi:PAS domain S-box-containing protein